MQINIEILDVKSNTIPTAKGSYQKLEVAYKDLGTGKVNGKNLVDFVIKEGKDLLISAKTGTQLTITMDKEAGKDGKEYWVWKKIQPCTGETVSKTTSGNPSPKSTYETPEERAIKQNHIIRQSCLSNAVHVLKTDKSVPELDKVFAMAEEMVGFIYNKPSAPFDTIEDDIPE